MSIASGKLDSVDASVMRSEISSIQALRRLHARTEERIGKKYGATSARKVAAIGDATNYRERGTTPHYRSTCHC